MRTFKVELKHKKNLGPKCKQKPILKEKKEEKEFILPFHKLTRREKIERELEKEKKGRKKKKKKKEKKRKKKIGKKI